MLGRAHFRVSQSAAQPALANYPFTTLLPNLGVVSFDYDSTMVLADLPGLLEEAHRGFGLGQSFYYTLKGHLDGHHTRLLDGLISSSPIICDISTDRVYIVLDS
ncbi:hypothetical protein H0E87_015091 [Populus deltoides]|uniref:G domain-containing protein n=1 Tax=Populus deltoides TaxID=3696 RepID=A0A8T2Y3S1_POPDE|nr:hypothetical protein H0E87_015091 [Populus deltoides]